MRELVLKKCNSCNALIKILEDCHCKCSISCCDEIMEEVVPNSTDGDQEKHVPEYSVNDGITFVKVNHIMDKDHYIEWIALVNDDIEEIHYFKPGDVCEVAFEYDEGTIYAYCNRHGLWKSVIK